MEEMEQISLVKEDERDEDHSEQIKSVNSWNAHQESSELLRNTCRIGGNDREIYDRSIYARALGDDDQPFATMVGMEGQCRTRKFEAVVK